MIKSLVFVLLVLSLAACNSSPTAPEVSRDPVCDQATGCIGTTKWIVLSTGRPFETKMTMKYANGTVIFNTCTGVGMDRTTISRNQISITGMPDPSGSNVSFQLEFSSLSCVQIFPFFATRAVRHSTVDTGGIRNIVFNL